MFSLFGVVGTIMKYLERGMEVHKTNKDGQAKRDVQSNSTSSTSAYRSNPH